MFGMLILVGPPVSAEITDGSIEQRLAALMSEMSLRDAVKTVSVALDVPKSRVYEIGLKLRDNSTNEGTEND